MNGHTDGGFDALRGVVGAAIHAHWKLFLAQGAFMMLLGLLAVALPQLSTIAIAIFVGWLFFVGGVFRIVMVLRSRRAPGYWWSLLTAALVAAFGLILLVQPQEGVLSLTLALIIIFAIEGISAILVAFNFRRHDGSWGWTLFSGLVDIVLAYLIWQGWPSTATWAIGLLIGINMFFFGLALTMTAIAARAMEDK